LKHKALTFVPPVLGIVVLAGIIVGLHHALRHIGPRDVLAALAATPRHEVAHAFMLLALSVAIMTIYDIPGILFARRSVSFPRLGYPRIALASFSAYALSHVLGAAALSSAAIRVRLYAQWNVPPSGIARIVAISGSMFTLGFLGVLGFLLLLHPHDVPLFGHAVPHPLLRGIGATFAAAVIFYISAAQRWPELRMFGRIVALPGSRVALAQLTCSCADIATACGILYVVLPDTPGMSYPDVLGIYLASFLGGMASGLPGGVGVFDSLLLLGLAGYMPPATALGAILLFRVLYFLAPACAAALCYGGHEIWINAMARRPNS
jgi:uncharacterized membrane protein YbhN (UPF0104 family)